MSGETPKIYGSLTLLYSILTSNGTREYALNVLLQIANNGTIGDMEIEYSGVPEPYAEECKKNSSIFLRQFAKAAVEFFSEQMCFVENDDFSGKGYFFHFVEKHYEEKSK